MIYKSTNTENYIKSSKFIRLSKIKNDYRIKFIIHNSKFMLVTDCYQLFTFFIQNICNIWHYLTYYE